MSDYYKPCKELDICQELIDKYYLTHQYEKCFSGHMRLAKKGYPLAECQVGYFYFEGLGVEQDLEQSFYWTEKSAKDGNRDAMFNLACLFYGCGNFVSIDLEKAKEWYQKARDQGQEEAIKKCLELGI